MTDLELGMNAFGSGEAAYAIQLSTFGLRYENHLEKMLNSLAADLSRVAINHGITHSEFRIEQEQSDYSRERSLGVFSKYSFTPNPFTKAYEFLEVVKKKDREIARLSKEPTAKELLWLLIRKAGRAWKRKLK